MGPAVAGVLFGVVVGWIAGRSSLRVTGARKNYRLAVDAVPGFRKAALTAIVTAVRNYLVIGVLLSAVLLAWLGPR